MGRPTVTAQDIDDLGHILAQMSDLKQKADEIKIRFKKSGLLAREGSMFSGVIIKSERTTLDQKKVRLALGKYAELCETTQVTKSVRVAAKKFA